MTARETESALSGPAHVRFAPSPTGRLHVGNIRTALMNWLLARASGGTFLLRFDDTDRERSREEFVEAIRSDLAWLGLAPDREIRQSDRLLRYAEIAEALKAEGALYPCFETEDELGVKRARQRARGLPPVYDRAALRLDPAEMERLRAEGRQPYWRFRLGAGQGGGGSEGEGGGERSITWHDRIRGPQTVPLSAVSDPVLIRADGAPLYTFTSVVDDHDFGITAIVRGEDHVTNTAVQIDLFRRLGFPVPAFAHHSLLLDQDGGPLSKRLGSLSIAGLREEGIEPMAILAYLAALGTSDPVIPVSAIGDLANRFDLAKFSRAPARFDPTDLKGLNARLLHEMPGEAVAERLAAWGVPAGFFEAVRGNLARFDEVEEWWRIATEPLADAGIAPGEPERALLAEAARLLPPEPWDETIWRDWTARVREATGRKGRDLFHPLRQALTGRGEGPELARLLPFIGRRRASSRLARAAGEAAGE